MFEGEFVDNKVIVRDAEAIEELFNNVWYGNPVEGALELELVEACLLAERGRLQVVFEGEPLDFQKLFTLCCKLDERFIPRYVVYRDLRERGLPVRTGFKGCDFRVYERGASPAEQKQVKWIIFTDSEDYTCELDKLGKIIKLAQNIRAQALWAVVDNDLDVTYYIVNQFVKL